MVKDSTNKVLEHDESHRIKIISFGFKKGDPPVANLLFDVRFLQNPYWVEELRPLSGLDKPVRDYVMEQGSACGFLEHLLPLVEQVMPLMFATKSHVFTIALGCTGGQHRSVSVAETLAEALRAKYPDIVIDIEHREMGVFRQLEARSSITVPGGGGQGSK